MNKGFPTPLPCHRCGEIPPINLVGAMSNKHIVGCMNICCNNMKFFECDTLGEALGKWDAYVINSR